MPLFRYRVKDQTGQQFTGLVEATSEAAAAEVLVSEGYDVLTILPGGRYRLNWQWERVTPRDRVGLSRQLATLVVADLPLVEALDTLAKQVAKKRLQQVLTSVARSVEGGKKLSESLAEHVDVFSNFYIKLVETGEQVGKLDEVLEYLADEEEKRYDLREQLKNMLIYPAFVLTVLLGVVIFMLAFVMPRMLSILAETGVELPLSTRLLISVSGWFEHWWWLLIAVIGLAVIGIGAGRRTPRGQVIWSRLQLGIPILRSVVQTNAIVQFSNSLAILLAGGVDMVTGLHIVAGVMSNTEYRDLILKAAAAVEDGNPLADTLSDSEHIPPMVSQMIRVGERVGRLEKTLEKITDFYTSQLRHTITTLVGFIEPLVIVIMGIGVGIVVSAMILPMYRIVGGF
ncbi:MAG: type II secretion system F family protein [Patescibacteria group bacterium]